MKRLTVFSVILLSACGSGGSSGSLGTIPSPPQENSAPVIISIPEQYAKEKTLYTYQISSIDSDGDTVTYSLVNGPSGATIDGSSGLFSWIPTPEQGGIQQIKIKASDGKISVFQDYTVQVQTTEVVALQFISSAVGGSIEITDNNTGLSGVKLDIPAGALPADTVITIGRISNPAHLPPSALAVELAPSMAFTKPVQITLPYTDVFLNELRISDVTELSVFTFNDSSGSWNEVKTIAADTVKQTITAQIEHFSVFTLGRKAIATVSDCRLFGNQSNFLIAEKGTIAGFWNNSGKNLLILHGICSSEPYFASPISPDDFIEYFKTHGNYTNILFYNYPSSQYIEGNASWLAAEILRKNKAVKFDVVAHSMGGLVARWLNEQYILKYPLHYLNNIEDLVMVGTPNFGSPQAVLSDFLSTLIFQNQPSASQLVEGSLFYQSLNVGLGSEILDHSNARYYWLTGDIGEGTDSVVPVPTTDQLGYLNLSGHRTFGPSNGSPPYDHTSLHEKCANNGICEEIIKFLAPGVSVIDTAPSSFTTSTEATFTFHSTNDGERFECSLDSETFGTCISPKVYHNLKVGPHLFSVRVAEFLSNNEVSSTALQWTILEPFSNPGTIILRGIVHLTTPLRQDPRPIGTVAVSNRFYYTLSVANPGNFSFPGIPTGSGYTVVYHDPSNGSADVTCSINIPDSTILTISGSTGGTCTQEVGNPGELVLNIQAK